MGADLGEGWEADNRKKPETKNQTEVQPPEKHRLSLAKEKRRGKTVTIVKPFCLSKADLQALLTKLKKRLGTGGTAKEDRLEFQGDIPDQVRSSLEAMGFRFKT